VESALVYIQNKHLFYTLVEAATYVAFRLRAARVGDVMPELVLARIVIAMVDGRIEVIAWHGDERADQVKVPGYLQPRDLNWADSSPKDVWLLVMRGMPCRVRPTRIFLSGKDLAAVFQPPEEVEDRPRRGPQAKVMARVEATMRSDFQAGPKTREWLRTASEDVLAECYGASRDTVRKARKSVLSVAKPESKVSKPKSKLSKLG